MYGGSNPSGGLFKEKYYYAITTVQKENFKSHTLLAQSEEARDLSSRKYRFESVMGYHAPVAEWNTQQAKNLWLCMRVRISPGVLGPISPTVEAMASETIKYQFESDIGYAGVPQLEEGIVSKAKKYEFKSHHLY